MAELREVATGLQFPEGPVAMSDGSVIVVEIAAGTVTRVGAGRLQGGDRASRAAVPNGAAIGPDGNLYVCNNGSAFDYLELPGMEGILVPRQPASNYTKGRIERIDLGSGAVEVIYDECDGRPLRAPNDLVFDGHGGFYFTDHGIREQRTADRTGVFYAQPDGSSIREVVPPARLAQRRRALARRRRGSTWRRPTPRACGTGRSRDPGDVTVPEGLLPHGGEMLDAAARASSTSTRWPSTVTATCASRRSAPAASPRSAREDGSVVEFVECGDLFVTNICFGGDDLRTAYITAVGRREAGWRRSGAGRA